MAMSTDDVCLLAVEMAPIRFRSFRRQFIRVAQFLDGSRRWGIVHVGLVKGQRVIHATAEHGVVNQSVADVLAGYAETPVKIWAVPFLPQRYGVEMWEAARGQLGTPYDGRGAPASIGWVNRLIERVLGVRQSSAVSMFCSEQVARAAIVGVRPGIRLSRWDTVFDFPTDDPESQSPANVAGWACVRWPMRRRLRAPS